MEKNFEVSEQNFTEDKVVHYIGQQKICCIDANTCSYLIWGR